MIGVCLRHRVVTAAPAGGAVTAGEFLVDPPTLINLGFEWFIQGDDNRNASVDVSYRKQGTADWKQALPLLRLQGERIRQGDQLDVISPNMFAGSILDLEPNTAYDTRFVLRDPDGVSGQATKTVTVRTRPEPMPAAGGAVYHVYPPGYKGAKMEPSFEGLMCAYNLTCAGTDWATAGRPRVKAGDTILVHAGVYKYNRYEYTNDPAVNRTTPLDGTYYLLAKGTAEKPIVIKGAGDGPAIFDGAGNFALFDIRAADYTYFEGLTFRNTDYAILAGTQFLAGAKGITVKRCRFEDIGAGVFTNYSGSSNFYIADNYFIGRHDPDHVIGWAGEFWKKFDGKDGQKFPPVMGSYIAVKVYGPGHVVAYNYVANFHDGIDTETYGNPDGSAAVGGREISDARVLRQAHGFDRLLQQLHDELPRQPVRGGRQHAQRAGDAEHDDQLGIACVLQPAGDRRAGVLDPEHRVSHAGRVDQADRRLGGRDLLQQHRAVGDAGAGRVERPLGEQPVPGRELGARDFRDEHLHELHLVGLQRLQAEPRRAVFVRLELAAVDDGCRLQFIAAWTRRGPRAVVARDPSVQHARGVQPCHASGSAQRPRRL